jgi:hypothetical protein
MRAAAAVLAIALLPLPAAAAAPEFEGVLESKLSGATTGTMRTWISKQGIRSETDVAVPEENQATFGKRMKMVILVRTKEPDVTYVLDENRKTYSAVKSDPSDAGDETFTAKRLGKDKVAGYACEKVLMKSADEESEVCVAPDLAAGDAWMKIFETRGETGGGFEKALRDVGVRGMPIRWSTKGASPEEAFTMELVSAKRQSVPASTFAIPAGYRESDMMMPMTSPETAKGMEEALKGLSPEERKKVEEMMKGAGGGKR